MRRPQLSHRRGSEPMSSARQHHHQIVPQSARRRARTAAQARSRSRRNSRPRPRIRSAQRAQLRDQLLVDRERSGRWQWPRPPLADARFGELSRRSHRRAGSFRQTPAAHRAAPASDRSACPPRLFAHGGAAEHQASASSNDASPARSTSMRAVEPRVIEQDGLLRQPAQAQRPPRHRSRNAISASGPSRAIDLFRGRASVTTSRAPRLTSTARSKWSPPAMPPAVLTMTASHSPASVFGKRMRSEPSSSTRARRVRAIVPRERRARCGRARGWRRKSRFAACGRQSPHARPPVLYSASARAQRGLVQVSIWLQE